MGHGTRPRVSVIVLSYNRPALLDRALASICAQTCEPFEILVVDNRSAASERVRDVAGRYPSARLMANDHNIGFTGGMNRGLAEAAGEYVYLTEDDIELDPGCLGALVAHLESRPEVGLAGPIMFDRHAGTVRCAGGRFELRAIYRMTILGAGDRDGRAFSEPFDVTYLPGSMMCGRLAVWRQLGGFRDDFFMYTEDVELCARVFEAGYTIVVVPAARVFHHEPEEAPASAILAFHKHKNLGALYLLHAPRAVLPSFVLRYGIVGILRTAAGDRSQLPAFLKAWWWLLRHAPRLLAARRSPRSGPGVKAADLHAEHTAPR